MNEPVADIDYEIREFPYFSTPSMTIITCLQPDCPYQTGKKARFHDALKAFLAHWGAKHA